MREKLKIALVHQPWSIVRANQRAADSVVLWTDHVARRLAREHHVFAYSRLGGGVPPVEQSDGVEHRRLHAPRDRYVKAAFQKLDHWGLRSPRRPFFASALAYRQFIRQAVRDLKQLRPDIVHIHNFSQFVPLVKRALPGAKVGLHMHCEWLTQLSRDMVGTRLGFADAVIGPSEYIAEGIRRRFPEHARRVRRVYNGADVDHFSDGGQARQADGDLTILYVGRISPEKGIHTLIDAFAIVAGQVKNARLRIVGPERIVPYEMMVPLSDDPRIAQLGAWFRGGYLEHLRERLRALPPDRVEFIDREFDHDDLAQVYSSADVFAFPSICDEAFGLPLVEAMASGCVPIATRKGAFPEIVEHERSGLLVEPADAPALAAAIVRLCGDHDLRRQMQAAARQRARERFSWDHVTQSLLEEYATCGS